MIKKINLFILMGYMGVIITAEESSLVPALEKLQVASPAGVAADSFSINYMWIANRSDAAQKWIYPGNDETVLKKFMFPLLRTAQANTPEDSINLWYDSKHTSPSAVKITKDMLKQFLSQSPTPCAPIKIKDLRKLAIVGKYESILSDKFPVYSRANFLRLAATVGSHVPQRYFIYSDLDLSSVKEGYHFPVPHEGLIPLNRKSLFDVRTQRNLDKYGIVVAQNGYNGTSVENSFHIVDTQHPTILDTIVRVILDPAFTVLQQALGDDSKTTPPTTMHRKDQQHCIYGGYLTLLKAATGNYEERPTKLVYHEMKNEHDIPFKR